MSAPTIAILRALQLGDLLCAVPAWRALRAAYPHARIALIGLPWARAFVERFPHYLDEHIAFPGYPGLPEQPPRLAALPSFLTDMERRAFDLVLQMQGNGRITNPVVALLGARAIGGFYAEGRSCPDPERFLPYPDDEPEIHRHLRLMEFLGIPSRGDALEFPLTHRDQEALQRLKDVESLRAGTYACVHPGGRGSDRRWPPESFGEVADTLAAYGLHIVITGSPEERGLTGRMGQAMRAPALDLTGRTDLGALGALLKGARLLVANDTGVSHLAAALRVPSVIVCTGSDPRRWAPLDRRLHRVRVHGEVTAADIIDEVLDLLTEHASREPQASADFSAGGGPRRVCRSGVLSSVHWKAGR